MQQVEGSVIYMYDPHSFTEGTFFIQKVFIVFLFLNKNICCGYSLEVPLRGTSNEYPQHMFLLRNKKIYVDTPSYL